MAASNKAAPASSGEAKLFWTAFTEAVPPCLLHAPNEVVSTSNTTNITRRATRVFWFRSRPDMTCSSKYPSFGKSTGTSDENRRHPDHHRQIGLRCTRSSACSPTRGCFRLSRTSRRNHPSAHYSTHSSGNCLCCCAVPTSLTMRDDFACNSERRSVMRDDFV